MSATNETGTRVSTAHAPVAALTPFKSFFTTVYDTIRNTDYTPHVHYIFTDDDHDLLTTALLSSLIAPLPSTLPAAAPVGGRTILVDLAPDGQSVTAAHSLSRDWAVQSAAICEAPTFGDRARKAAGDLMLYVEGAHAPVKTASNDSNVPDMVGSGVEEVLHRVEDLADRWRRELELLRAVRDMTNNTIETMSSK